MLAGAAAAVAALIASPAVAQTQQQQQFAGPQHRAADSTGARNVTRMRQDRVESRAAYDERRRAARPGDVAAGVAGGAIGTAGALATAPFRGDSYAYYRDTNRGYRARAAYDERRTGFWPGDVAAGVVGGAIGTAGAIATAPFTPTRSDSYAYYRDTTTTAVPNRAYRARAAYRGDPARAYDERRTGFWPGDVAAGVVGGAIGTAGALATAPFRPSVADSYAYYGDTPRPSPAYMPDYNGPSCVPGSEIILNGQRMLCQ
jgi:hypothetical protein